MESNLDRGALRRDLSALDERQQKIVGAMMAILFKNPARVRDREWLAEQFTEVTLLAGGFEADTSADDVVELVREDVCANIRPLLDACIRLFQCVGDDLATRARPTHEDAMLQALSYFGRAPGRGPTCA